MAQARVLAERVMPGEGMAWELARMVAANLLLVLCAKIAVPLSWTPVPVTGQTFGVLLIAVLLGSRRAAVVLGLYLLEGTAGLPVFQPFGVPGPLRLLGPTGGYLLAYPLAAFVTGWLVERAWELPGREPSPTRRASLGLGWLVAALVVGELIIFAGGCARLAIETGWKQAVWIGAAPFLPGEFIKMALVVVAVRGLEFARPDTSRLEA